MCARASRHTAPGSVTIPRPPTRYPGPRPLAPPLPCLRTPLVKSRLPKSWQAAEGRVGKATPLGLQGGQWTDDLPDTVGRIKRKFGKGLGERHAREDDRSGLGRPPLGLGGELWRRGEGSEAGGVAARWTGRRAQDAEREGRMDKECGIVAKEKPTRWRANKYRPPVHTGESRKGELWEGLLYWLNINHLKGLGQLPFTEGQLQNPKLPCQAGGGEGRPPGHTSRLGDSLTASASHIRPPRATRQQLGCGGGLRLRRTTFYSECPNPGLHAKLCTYMCIYTHACISSAYLNVNTHNKHGAALCFAFKIIFSWNLGEYIGTGEREGLKGGGQALFSQPAAEKYTKLHWEWNRESLSG